MPPICMPMLPRLAKPQRAKVAIEKVRGARVDFCAPSWVKAMNSLRTARVPRRLPTNVGVVPWDADEPGNGCADDAEDGVERVREGDVAVCPEGVGEAEHDGVEQADEGKKADEHDGDVEGEPAAVDGAAGDSAEEVFAAVLFVWRHVDGAGGFGGCSVSGTSILATRMVPGAVMMTAERRSCALMPKLM